MAHLSPDSGGGAWEELGAVDCDWSEPVMVVGEGVEEAEPCPPL